MSLKYRDRPVLIADIGGTWARFARALPDQGTPLDEQVLSVADYTDFVAAATAYIDSIPGQNPSEALCAIATPVLDDFLRMTNHHWAFSIDATRRRLGLETLRFVNDFAAQALAIPHLPAEAVTLLCGPATRPQGTRAVLGPGTGLGVSALIPTADGWQALPGEGGHATFAAVTEREALVAQWLRQRHGHCSAERVASARGLVEVHAALCSLDGLPAAELSAAEITRRAAAEESVQCREAVDLFCDALASVAGNVALILGAVGGVYLCGGVIGKLGALFDAQRFWARFAAKGRYQGYLQRLPVYHVAAQNPSLLGLARNLDTLL